MNSILKNIIFVDENGNEINLDAIENIQFIKQLDYKNEFHYKSIIGKKSFIKIRYFDKNKNSYQKIISKYFDNGIISSCEKYKNLIKDQKIHIFQAYLIYLEDKNINVSIENIKDIINLEGDFSLFRIEKQYFDKTNNLNRAIGLTESSLLSYELTIYYHHFKDIFNSSDYNGAINIPSYNSLKEFIDSKTCITIPRIRCNTSVSINSNNTQSIIINSSYPLDWTCGTRYIGDNEFYQECERRGGHFVRDE